MENKEINVYWKNNYGVDHCYPFCRTAKKLIKLTGSKTFNGYHLSVIEDLGYSVNVVPYVPSQMRDVY